ncbi:hypothetical protein EBR21_07960 [bacterium]|nr:hypothetical protein [bacterium]
MNLRRVLRASCFLVLILESTSARSAFAWGSFGHSMIAEIGSELADSGHDFWSSNKDLLGQLANVPDVVWKQSDTIAQERPTHWFQIDNYVDNPVQFPQALYSYANAISQHQVPFVTENGTVPWRSEQMYMLALAALKRNDDVTAIQMAGALSHYIGDISQPLHVTRNYDGPAPNKNGIHKFFETDNLNSTDKSQLRESVLQTGKTLLARGELTSSFAKGLVPGTFQEVIRSSADVQTILDIDSHHGRNGQGSKQQLEIAQQRLSDGAASLSIVLSRLWKESGRTDVAKKVNADPPEFVQVDYDQSSASVSEMNPPSTNSLLNDDCSSSK